MLLRRMRLHASSFCGLLRASTVSGLSDDLLLVALQQVPNYEERDDQQEDYDANEFVGYHPEDS